MCDHETRGTLSEQVSPKTKTPALCEKDETTGALWFVTALFCWRSAWVSCLSLLRSGRQTSRPSAPSGADMRLPVFLLLYHSACDELVSCLIGNNNRNCKLRIPDCRIGIWNIIYTVGECVTSFCFFSVFLHVQFVTLTLPFGCWKWSVFVNTTRLQKAGPLADNVQRLVIMMNWYYYSRLGWLGNYFWDSYAKVSKVGCKNKANLLKCIRFP